MEDVSDLTQEQRLFAAIVRLSKYSGKFEIKFMPSDRVGEQVCLLFIKIPIMLEMKELIREQTKGATDLPLSVGRISVEDNENSSLLVGAIRIKTLNKIGNVGYGLIDRMFSLLSRITGDEAELNS